MNKSQIIYNTKEQKEDKLNKSAMIIEDNILDEFLKSDNKHIFENDE